MSGNDHTLEGNTLSDLVYETADAGAFYMGRDWYAYTPTLTFTYLISYRSYRGNVIKQNTFQNINTILGTGEDKAIGLYLGTNSEQEYAVDIILTVPCR